MMSPTASPATPAQQLQSLLVESEDISDFLDELVAVLADDLSTDGVEVWCAVVLLRPRRPLLVASSSPEAETLDEMQYDQGEGPCLTSAKTQETVVVEDTLADSRWGDYGRAIAAAGVRAVLALPLHLQEDAQAALNVYADRRDAFDQPVIDLVERHALALTTTLRLAVRLARHQETAADLQAAMASRTAINLAVGIIMGQNRCTQDEAFDMLRTASNHRNVKLRELAADLVASVGKGPATTHFNR